MSISASLDIHLLDTDRDAIDVLKCLLHHGWTIYDNGEKVFLPENDNGMFDWK